MPLKQGSNALVAKLPSRTQDKPALGTARKKMRKVLKLSSFFFLRRQTSHSGARNLTKCQVWSWKLHILSSFWPHRCSKSLCLKTSCAFFVPYLCEAPNFTFRTRNLTKCQVWSWKLYILSSFWPHRRSAIK